ncbi:sulfite exporter TauE/SafE family protein [Carboxylicivirga sediminis]|uniref:Probable membrane transporter protein n=1 Tax=Carboxylicivirga sediminis TaxID=2006564 RepID=A0A941F7G5_9BACT|nr:sulfite exporter TauE/SafE family protein [Carboxylicivirga sediminis]MBR8537218.1 sulfite exporter TauE/SafE family protein [Carboxylicivirga sediminis]
MDLVNYVILVLAGVGAGFINVVAGGGSLITLPLMIFLGLPPAIANGSNRIALLAQNIVAVSNFKAKNVSPGKFGVVLGCIALMGAVIGAHIAVDIPAKLFNRILSVVMMVVAILMAFNPSYQSLQGENLSKNRRIVAYLAFFLIGIYGGFLHAGIGFIMMLALVKINGFSLVKTNSLKVTVALIYTVAALGVFIYEGMIDWKAGSILAIGSATGGWLGSHFSVNKGDKWIKRIVLAAIVLMAIKLWVF